MELSRIRAPVAPDELPEPDEAPPQTLREWLKEGPFSLTLSQGFFCFPALVGALLAIEQALNGCDADDAMPSPFGGDAPRPLRTVVHACSGSSSGALVAAFVAAGHPLRSLAPRIRELSPKRIVDPLGDSGLLSGGLCRGDAAEETIRDELGAVTFERCRVPLGVSALDLKTRRLVALREGDVAAAVVASCAVPGLFSPRRVGEYLLTDVAFLADAAGAAALPALPPSGRVLSIVAGDWNLPLPLRPSQLPERCRAPEATVVSLTLRGITRVWPWAVARRGDAAHGDAYRATVAALDAPLRAGREARHFVVDA